MPWCASAQDLNNLTPRQLEMIRERLDMTGASEQFTSPVDSVRGQTGGYPGRGKRTARELAGQGLYVNQTIKQPLSRIESDYSARVGHAIRQFGYDVFATGTASDDSFSGAISEDYRLGIGDELVVTLLGQSPRTISTRVDREGRVVLPGMQPIAAMGRAFGEFRAELEARVKTSMIGTEVFVSVGAVRMIRIMVAGEVQQPGMHQLTGLSTVLDALYKSGGVKKTGSLRRIRVHRSGREHVVDFYKLLLYGRFSEDRALMDGDRIVVHAIGPTVAVGGDVKRPAIFELRQNDGATSLAALVQWAGGALRPRGSRFVHISLDKQGKEEVSERIDLPTIHGGDGDILLVQSGGGKMQGSVFLTGHVRSPGLRSLATASKLSDLVGDISALKEAPYMLFAILSSVDRATGARRLVPIDLPRVFAGKFEQKLQADDVLIVLSLDDIRYLLSTDVQRVISGRDPLGGWSTGGRGGSSPAAVRQTLAASQGGLLETLIVDMDSDRAGNELTASQERTAESAERRGSICRGLLHLATIVASERVGRFSNALRGVVRRDAAEIENVLPCPDVYDLIPELLVFVLEHSVAVNGEVRAPGVFPVVAETALGSLLPYAGGLTREADRSNLELSRFGMGYDRSTRKVDRRRIDLTSTKPADILLTAGDIIRINPVFSARDEGPVVLSGEFILPGVYDITRGERLSQVIARAGGLTKQAFPYGAVFARERVRREEKRNFERYLRELQSAIVTAATLSRTEEGGAAAIAAMGNLVSLLKETEPLGRVVLEADPTVLQVRPELDTVLEPGDRIHMPKRANFVTITGEVLNPGSVAFQSGLGGDKYVNMAGGYTMTADDDRVFVVLPSGSAQPLALSFWNYTPEAIPPGSTIVVPRDPLPFDWLTLTKDLISIFSDLAITTAALNSLGND